MLGYQVTEAFPLFRILAYLSITGLIFLELPKKLTRRKKGVIMIGFFKVRTFFERVTDSRSGRSGPFGCNEAFEPGLRLIVYAKC